MKPKITVNCVASHYVQRDERIIEFSHKQGGGLIAFLPTEDGRLLVNLYRLDPSIVAVGEQGRGVEVPA
jgi:hypothetical protein